MRNDRPGDQDPLIAPEADRIFQGRGQGQKGLAGAGLADQGDHFDLRIHQQFHGHALLLAAGPDLPGGLEFLIEMAPVPGR